MKLLSGVFLACMAGASAAAGAGPSLHLVPPGVSPQRGPSEHFTGTVTVTSPFAADGGASMRGATVTFQPGARTHWHSHPLGQLLIVTAGEGRVQAEGGPVRTIRAGDVVWTPPGVRHWHGAAPDHAMSHVAVGEAAPGRTVTWGEPVGDETYNHRPSAETQRH